MKNTAGEPFGAGVPANQFMCELGAPTSIAVSQEGRRLKMVVGAAHNRIDMKITLDRSRPDFHVELPFAVTTTIYASTGAPGRLLTVDSVTPVVTTGAPVLDGATAFGDLVLKGAEALGYNISQIAKGHIKVPALARDGVVAQVNNSIGGALPPQVANAANLGLWYGNDVLLVAFRPEWPMPRGTVSGTIKAGAGALSGCVNWPITAKSTGPGRLANPIGSAPRFEPGRILSSTARSSPPTRGADGMMRCHYQIADAIFGVGPTASVPRAGRTGLEPVPQVHPNEQPIRLPANSVNFEMAMGLGTSNGYANSVLGEAQFNQARPGTSIKVMPIDRVTMPAGTIRTAPVVRVKPRLRQP